MAATERVLGGRTSYSGAGGSGWGGALGDGKNKQQPCRRQKCTVSPYTLRTRLKVPHPHCRGGETEAQSSRILCPKVAQSECNGSLGCALRPRGSRANDLHHQALGCFWSCDQTSPGDICPWMCRKGPRTGRELPGGSSLGPQGDRRGQGVVWGLRTLLSFSLSGCVCVCFRILFIYLEKERENV